MVKNFFDMLYEDNLGEGAFGTRHFIWIGLTILLAFGLYFLFKRYKKEGRIFLVSVSAFIFVFRVVKQTARAILGVEGFLNVLPWHMCTVLSFLMPIVIIFNIKKLKPAVYSLGIMGGAITLLLGDYFSHGFLTIYELEGMFTHSMLILLPIVDIAISNFSFKFKQAWECVLGILVLMGWATLANEVIFANQNTNYMYLKENALPFEVAGIHYFFIYAVIFAVFLLAVFGIPELCRKIRKKH
jgi:uncharacterized membrane protein YwaF